MPIEYVITVHGHLDQHWSAWFDGLTITNIANGESTLTGPVGDQAALHGVLVKIRDLGLPLIAITPVVADGSVDTNAPNMDDGASQDHTLPFPSTDNSHRRNTPPCQP